MPRTTRRSRTEAALSALFALILMVTLVSTEWIEAVFGVDPDRGSGMLEWLVVAILAIAAIVPGLLAVCSYRTRTA